MLYGSDDWVPTQQEFKKHPGLRDEISVCKKMQMKGQTIEKYCILRIRHFFPWLQGR